jgi:integrase
MTELYAAWLLDATTRMRRGDVLGLHWRDVSLDQGRLSVHQALVLVGNEPALQEPKTVNGRRPRRLPRSKPTRRRRSKNVCLRPDCETAGTSSFAGSGTWVHPEALSRRFEFLVRQTSLPEIRLTFYVCQAAISHRLKSASI